MPFEFMFGAIECNGQQHGHLKSSGLRYVIIQLNPWSRQVKIKLENGTEEWVGEDQLLSETEDGKDGAKLT